MTDIQMMEDVRDGKVERLAVLFERHHVPLFNFFLRMTGSSSTSEDLVQDVFYRILNYRHTYKGQSKFTTWMYQIARNTHVDYLRKRKEELPLDEQWNESLSPDPSPDENLERRQDAVLMREALAKLPMKKREILILSRYQDLKYKEIAELLGCQIGTVKAHVHRAIKDLSKIYFALSGGTVS